MIKINKCNPPKVLVDNQASWTKDLLDAVNSYGTYSNIPEAEKKSLLSHYRHKDIQKALFDSSFFKCAFCECKPATGGYMEVEHFAPKSIYPALTFDWDNLLPACRKCNDAKTDTDTKVNPIIDPSKVDPETLLTYDSVRICPKKNTSGAELAKATIETCNLNRSQLYHERANLMVALTEYMDELKDKLGWIEEADTTQKRKIRLTKLKNSLEKIELILKSDQPYAGFSRWFVSQYPEFSKAKTMVASMS